MIPRRMRGRSLDDVYELIDQLFVIAARTDGRLAGVIKHLSGPMPVEDQLEFRRLVQEVELARLTAFVDHVEKREPEVATRMHETFEEMKVTEQW